MTRNYDKLKTLLIELFQLDQPDLDFGLYRIMHAKSAEVTQFLDKELLPQVTSAFGQFRSADKAEMERELNKVIAGVEAAGMEPEQSPKVQVLRELLKNDGVDVGRLESEVYDHLFSFFRRYYSEGDFLAKRVYKPGVYAIPYEGEEVMLHWANKDQYYIKTSEYLRDYAFRLRPDLEEMPMRVHFRLADVAEGEHGNVKASEGKERRFKLADENPVTLEDGELMIRFTYQPDTAKQKELNAAAEETIAAMSDASLKAWITELGKPNVRSDGSFSGTRLRLHLDRYTARNTFDYFIHKDLGGFLRRELDFFIKNEVMHLDDIENESAPRVEQYLSKIKVIRKIAGKIIDFLAQLENFQKRLWLKKKFVVETRYCMTLDRIPAEFYGEIAANPKQWEQWRTLGMLETPNVDQPDLFSQAEVGSVGYLEAHPFLMADTALFDEAFKSRLLSTVDNLDETLDGLLMHGDNFHGLNLLQTRYREQVKCVYIDPPYNTSASEISYKNSYKHSSWLSLISDRVALGKNLLARDGNTCVTIDDVEINELLFLMKMTFGVDNIEGIVPIRINPSGRPTERGFALTHEYGIFIGNSEASSISKIPRTEIQLRRFSELDEDGRFEWRNLRREGSNSDRVNGERQYYPIYANIETGNIRVPSMQWEEDFRSWAVNDSKKSEEVEIFPINDDGQEKNWRWSEESVRNDYSQFLARIPRNGSPQVYYKYRENKQGTTPLTMWVDSRFSATEYGTNVLKNLFSKTLFSYPKSIYAVEECLIVMGMKSLVEKCVLDFFAGSGTTAHAVISLNRYDNGHRKYILVEQGDYFDTVLKPRIQKVVYSSDWKDGKAMAPQTGLSHAFKVLKLESYEDALNNLEPRRTSHQQLTLDSPEAQGAECLKEQYILRYMLDVETRGSQSLLNVQAFTDPTAYKLKVKRPGSDESSEMNIDLLESFNWLVGLTVQNLAAPQSFTASFERDSEKRLRLHGPLKPEADAPYWFRTVTGTVPDGRKTLIIWRKLTGEPEQDNLVLDEWFTLQGYAARESDFALIYVNGGNNLENLKQPGDLWKVRLIEEDFHRLMFEAKEGV